MAETQLNLKDLKKKKMSELTQQALDLGVESPAGMRKSELIFAMLQAHGHAKCAN